MAQVKRMAWIEDDDALQIGLAVAGKVAEGGVVVGGLAVAAFFGDEAAVEGELGRDDQCLGQVQRGSQAQGRVAAHRIADRPGRGKLCPKPPQRGFQRQGFGVQVPVVPAGLQVQVRHAPGQRLADGRVVGEVAGVV